MQSNIEEPKAISWKHIGWGIGAVAIALCAVIGVAVAYNTYRELTVISEYTNETRALVSAKQGLFRQLFTTTMSECQVHDDQERDRQKREKEYTRSDICPVAQAILSNIGVETLKNSSAILYLAVQGKTVVMIEASGKYHPPSSIIDDYTFAYGHWGDTPDVDLQDYFLHNKPLRTMWWDYINYIPGKEVVVPVEIDGQRVGYIFRGVIER